MQSLLMDFLNYVLFLIIIACFILYFIVGDRFEEFTDFLRSLAPIGVFGLVFLARLLKTRKDNKKSRDEGNTDIVIYLTTKDKFINDVIVFSIPIIILVIAFFGGGINVIDIFQSLIIFLIIFIWNSYIFKSR